MRRMMQWMMAAILICGSSLFTACVKEDNAATQETADKALLFQWITDYAEVVTDEGEGIPHNRVVKVYEFFDDGTGYYEHYLLNDDELQDALYLRGENGDFMYSVTGNQVTVGLMDEFEGTVDSTWTLTFANNWMGDPDGRAFRHTTENEHDLVFAWYEEWHGGAAEGTIDLSEVKENIIVADGSTLTGTLTDAYKISIAPGATVTLHKVNINKEGKKYKQEYSGITCLGSATIILSDTNYVRGLNPAGTSIEVPENRTLVIKGDGMLEVRGSGGAPALLASALSSKIRGRAKAGNLEIQGGTVKAYSDIWSCAIGASSGVPCGNITISGGTVIAETSGDLAGSAIGTSLMLFVESAVCGDITITGGTVVATAGKYGCGIGSSIGPCGNITISGGTITAKGGEGGAGIGAAGTRCGDITITGGDVYAAGGKYAAGIGSGYSSGGILGIYKSINISGGIVLAYGGEDGAAIGTGMKTPKGTQFDSGTINITGGTIDAHGRGKGAGIGAGKDNKCGTINVNLNSGNTLRLSTEGYFDHENYDYEHWAGAVGSYDLANCGALNIGLGVAVSYCVGKKTPYTEEKFQYIRFYDDRVGIVHKQGGVRFETCPHFEYEDYPELCQWCTHM